MKLKPIKQQVVVVVGANSGIGRETATEFALKGARVIAAGRSMDEMETLASEIRAKGGEITPAVADTTQFESLTALAQKAVDTYGSLDSWVHLPAVSVYAPFDQTSPDEFRRVIEVNLIGQAYGAMAALPFIKRQGRGSLIHISSIEARQSMPYHSAYAAAKHGIPGFIDSLRMELEHEGYTSINVANIMPGSINTPFFAKSRTHLGVEPRPIPPVYEPEIVARAILFASEHMVGELPVGGSAKAFRFLRRYAPSMANSMIRSTGFTAQRSSEPKSDQAPTNLYDHLGGYDQARGEYSQRARPLSLSTWFDIHPAVRIALAAAVITGAFMAVRAIPLKPLTKSLPAARKQVRKIRKNAQKVSRDALKTSQKMVAKGLKVTNIRRSRTLPERILGLVRS